MESFGSCKAHLVAPAGCRVHSVNSPAQFAQPSTLAGLRSLTGLQRASEKSNISRQTAVRTLLQNGLCNILTFSIDIKILLYFESCVSLWNKITENIPPFAPVIQIPLWPSYQHRRSVLKEVMVVS